MKTVTLTEDEARAILRLGEVVDDKGNDELLALNAIHQQLTFVNAGESRRSSPTDVVDFSTAIAEAARLLRESDISRTASGLELANQWAKLAGLLRYPEAQT